MPFGIGDFLTCLFACVGFIRRYGESANAVSAFEIGHFDVVAQMPNQHSFI
jgi:hypothetical protein